MGWIEKETMDGMAYYFNTDSKAVSWNKPEELMTAEEIEENKGEWVWVPHATDMWQEARVQKRDDDGTVHVLLKNNRLMKIPADRVMQGSETNGRKQVVPLWELKKGNLRFLEDDLVMLDPVNEAFIIRNLAQRYAKKQIYTWVGAGRTVLVSVNPYQDIGLYGPEHIDLHRNKPPNKAIPPHVFDIANDSYDSMAFDGNNQSILISGESGAGKTEATKQCLKYLAAIGGSADSNIEERVLVANPLLEAFGNAKTIRNINSSRFGKWMEVYFNRQTTQMQGSKIINYLLERSRVVHQQKDERNFHIFYELCSDQACKDNYFLLEPNQFNYLSQSGCIDVPQIDDVKDFVDVQQAMALLEFSDAEQKSVLQLTAAVLWLGNVDFLAKEHKGSVAGSEIKPGDAAQIVAKLLELDEDIVSKILCYRTIRPKAGKDSAVIPLSTKDARTACDSLAMGIYGKLFNWMVKRVNDALGVAEGRFIGILDIFGFEIFENNSFEQLCINYANEKLQQLFNKTTFKEEEELYKREGIDFTPVNFIDNQPVLDLVEQKPYGILPVLDDECVIPEGNEQKFMAKIDGKHGGTAIFQADDKRRFENTLSFEIKHYAGVVKYDASLFMTKNVDTVFDDMYVAVSQSGNDLLKGIFEDSDKRIKTISYKFRGQLEVLMKTLNLTESRFIRCIKPNDDLSPNKFIASSCVEQLRYSGVFEAVDIRKTGYPFRYTHVRFIYRYSCINYGYRYKSDESNATARIKEIFRTSNQDFSGCQIGSSMVLYRANEYKLLKLLRNLALEKLIPIMQGVVRGGITREYFRRLKANKKTLQREIRKANNFDGITQTIKDVAPQACFDAKQLRLFNFELTNLNIARVLRDDLGDWVKLEKRMQAITDKCAKVKPDPFYEDLKRLEKDFEEREAKQGLKAKDAHVNFYKQRQYVQPKVTKRQRELLVEIKELIHQCILGQLDEKVEAAVANFDRKGIVESLELADQYKHSTPKITEARAMLAKFEELDTECDKAVKCVSRSMLEAALAKAKDLRQENEVIQKAAEMFALDERAFVELEYLRAKEVGDNERMIHREIRMMEFKYDDIDHSTVNIGNLANYRTEVEYAQAKLTSKVYGAATLRLSMRKWTKKSIPTSLTIPQVELESKEEGHETTDAEKAQIKEFKKKAKDNFKNILIYLGDKKSKKERNMVANEILQTGLQAYKNKDNSMLAEMYCQVIKQLTDNPSATPDASDPRTAPEAVSSYHNALLLLAMMLSVFPTCTEPYEISVVADPTFDDAVVVWILQNVTSEDRKRYLSALHNSKYGPAAAQAPDASVVRNKFTELKGMYSLDGEKDSGPEEGNLELYLQ